MPLLGEVDLQVDLPIWALTIEIRNCHSWPQEACTRGVDLPLDLPIWNLTIEIWYCHFLTIDASTGGGRSAIWSAYMNFNNRNQKLPFLATRCLYQGGRSATWSAYINFNNRNLKLPFLAIDDSTRGVDPPLDLPIWACNVKLPFRSTGRSTWEDRSATWSACMNFNNRNLKFPFLASRCLYWER